MTLEEKAALGRVLKRLRASKNCTQEILADKSGVPIRSVQRAERGQGISKHGLSCLATVLGTSAENILAQAKTSAEAIPIMRLACRELLKGKELLTALTKRGIRELAPEGEHEINILHADQLIELQSEAEESLEPLSQNATLERQADEFIKSRTKLGFHVFSGSYFERIPFKNREVQRPTTIIFAALKNDSRIRKTAKGRILDYIIDNRRTPLAKWAADLSTFYAWAKHQLLSRYDGEERVAEACRNAGIDPGELGINLAETDDSHSKAAGNRVRKKSK